jgi:serine/threonine-protein kinase
MPEERPGVRASYAREQESRKTYVFLLSAREARAGDTLRSEHVARVHEVGTTSGGTPFIVMEHLAGQDLAAVLEERGKLPVADAADLLLQACEAISEAHTHGIIHRDLKPGNLFVTTSVDGLPFVKVLDFGISKASFPQDMVVTDTSAFFGSPLYMCPEQLAGAKDVDARADVWALGIVLYELLAGVPPFRAETFPLVCAAILSSEYAKLSTLRTDIPAAIDALISETLAKKPESRLPSVEAFARKLAPFGTSGARQSYERIERLAAGATHPELARPEAKAAPLAETAEGLGLSHVRTDSPVVKTDALSPVKRARSGREPTLTGLVGLAAVAVAGGFLGFRQMHAGSPATASSSPQLPEVAPSASAVASTPSPIAAAESPEAAGTVSSAPAPVVLADPARAPSVPSAKTVDECAKGATASCEAKGTGAPKDVARAVKLYEAECDGGAGSACNALGALDGSGTDCPRTTPRPSGSTSAAATTRISPRASTSGACTSTGQACRRTRRWPSPSSRAGAPRAAPSNPTAA